MKFKIWKTANGKYSRIAKRNLRFVKSSGQIDGKDMTVQVNRIEVFPCEISKLQMGTFCYMYPCVGIGRGIFLECSEVFGMVRITSSHVCSTGRNSKNQMVSNTCKFLPSSVAVPLLPFLPTVSYNVPLTLLPFSFVLVSEYGWYGESNLFCQIKSILNTRV